MGETKEYMTKSYNILYLVNSGEIIGGGEISLLGLIKELNRKKFNPLVICPEGGSLFNELNKIVVETKIVRMETIRNLNIFSWVRTVNKLIQLIKKREINLIHSNGSRATIFGGIAARLTKTPLIWHVRIADSDKLLDKFLVKLADKIIVVSKAVSRRFDWIEDKEDKIVLVYNGIDLERFKPDVGIRKVRGKISLSSETPLVATVGRLDWYKGHKYLLVAAEKVVQALPDARFLIVGDGEYRERLENQVKQLNLDKNVIFTGNRKDIPEILASIDLFVLSSVSEGFGRAAAEAMACGKPVVATKAGGLSEVVEDGITGRLVPPKNPAALAKAIIELLKDKKKSENIGIAGRKRVEKLFSIEKNVKSIEELYEKILTRENLTDGY
ncbi:MAG: glycosyltransferase [Candidatus Desulfaltia sp.]|nr:glycosyltransferase [Candidatus Desulfaltia sp.]